MSNFRGLCTLAKACLFSTHDPNQMQTKNFLSKALKTALLTGTLFLPGPVFGQDYPFGSTADTVFDIIREDDPSSFVCLDYAGREIRQMWDKRQDNEFDLNVFLFRAYFSEGPPVDIILNPEFQTENEARAEALKYTRGLGQLPLILRRGIGQFGIHKGNEGFHGGPGKIFMYQDKADLRITQKHLEESIMHESVHASLDAEYSNARDWRNAQANDATFVTRYAAENPDGEDLAESVLFAYGLLYHPGRIPPVDSQVIAASIPARIAVISEILAIPQVVARTEEPPGTCQKD